MRTFVLTAALLLGLFATPAWAAAVKPAVHHLTGTVLTFTTADKAQSLPATLVLKVGRHQYRFVLSAQAGKHAALKNGERVVVTYLKHHKSRTAESVVPAT